MRPFDECDGSRARRRAPGVEAATRARAEHDAPVIYAMIFMVPIAPFVLFGCVLRDSRGMVVLVYLIGMISMIFTVEMDHLALVFGAIWIALGIGSYLILSRLMKRPPILQV
jgi:hypothetical protein